MVAPLILEEIGVTVDEKYPLTMRCLKCGLIWRMPNPVGFAYPRDSFCCKKCNRKR